MDTIAIEDKYAIPFFNKIPVSVEKGEGVYVWDEKGNRYIDFTSGWGVTCLGHSNPVIINAVLEQAGKIFQNPCSGLTYSPARAKLLQLMAGILPGDLTRLFFSNSGAESNDAVLKLARKVSGRSDIIASAKGFHGRTISTASATGQAKHREKFNPLMPNYRFVPFNDIRALEKEMDEDVAAVMLEPIQGEGGVNIPDPGYLETVSDLCKKNGSFFIVDEIQTGFCRTGPMFNISPLNLKIDFLTMAKGIAGGFPFGAFAVSEDVAEKIEIGDHGGTFCGNPIGCAVAHAVIKYLLDHDIESHVKSLERYFINKLESLKIKYPSVISEVRGRGLLIAIEISSDETAGQIYKQCIENGLLINLTQGHIFRFFPALTVTEAEADEGLHIFESLLNDFV